jgi:Dockerin type I domain
MDMLTGDTTGDHVVNSSDVSQTKSRSGQSVGSSNFRSDLTVDGNLNSSDVSLVKSKSGTALP